jgi:hypothetical protein
LERDLRTTRRKKDFSLATIARGLTTPKLNASIRRRVLYHP